MVDLKGNKRTVPDYWEELARAGMEPEWQWKCGFLLPAQALLGRFMPSLLNDANAVF